MNSYGRTDPLRAIAILVLLAVVCGTTTCGSDPSDEEQAKAAVEELQEALGEKDVDRACELMTDDAQRHVGEAGHDAPISCAKDLRALSQMVADGLRKADRDSRPNPGRPEVADVAVRGSKAVATLTLGEGSVARVPLVKEADGWKVDALYGGMPARHQENKLR